MRHTANLAALAASLLAAACGSSQSNAYGQASYVQPQADGGEPVAPQQRQDDLALTVSIGAAADFRAIDALLCSLTSGNITGSLKTNGQVDSSGNYRGSFDAEADATFESPVCGAVRDVTLNTVTSLTVQASLPANSTNCEAYCTASANSQCSSASGSCHTNAKAACDGRCSAASRITGKGSLSSSSASELNSKLGTSGTLDAQVDLVFDALE